ncbi:phospholipid-binding protein MlaC [Shewanella marina]|uniref:phospholipid-binding protein MlaC n=1 Tax=Shewanella marina TaxID=487319 RepID=UPI00047056E0|nr:phospholipid-binding protein MlaC [Shewanella marina]
MFKQIVQLFSALLVVIGVITVPAQAQTIDTQNPYKMMEAVAQQTFDRFNQDQAQIKADPNYLKTIVTVELMPFVDYKYASYKVLGQYLRQTSKQQRADFVKAFEGYLVTTYAQAFTEYTNQKVEFEPARDFAGEKIVPINVQIIEQGRPPIKVQFKVRRLKDDSWKAFDMVAEGVSLLSSKQSEVTTLIRQQGIDNVIKLLQQKAAESIHTSSDKQSK